MELLALVFIGMLHQLSHAFTISCGSRRSFRSVIDQPASASLLVCQSTTAKEVDPTAAEGEDDENLNMGDDIDFEEIADAFLNDFGEGDVESIELLLQDEMEDEGEGNPEMVESQLAEEEDSTPKIEPTDIDNDEAPTDQEELVEIWEMLEETPAGTIDMDDLVLVKDSIETILDSLLQDKEQIDMTLAETAEQLLFRMVQEWKIMAEADSDVDKDQIEMIEPTETDFLMVLKAWEAVCGKDNERINTNDLPEVISHVMKVFNFEKSLVQNGLASLEPTTEMYEIVLHVLAKSRARGGDRLVWSVFEEIENKSAYMYSTVIPCLARSRDRGAADRAEQVLKEAVEKFPPGMVNGKPTGIQIDTFNVILTAWAKSGLDYGPQRAEQLMVFMDSTDTENGNHGLIKPNIYSFTSLIDAYAQQTDWDGAAQSERILRRLVEQYLSGEENIPEPSVASWTIAISAWSRLSKKGFRGAAHRAGNLLSSMEDLHQEGKIGFGPDAILYVTCMNAYAFSKIEEGPAKAEEILDLTNELYLEGDESMKPSVRSIGIIIDAWIRSNSTDAMEEAEVLLERYEDIIDSSESQNDGGEVPDQVRDIYRNVLFGWAKKGFPEQAQHYLTVMIEKGMKPDCICYDKIIDSNTQLNDEGAFKRTYQVFELMEANRKIGDVIPNERAYTSFIRAMTKAKIPNLAYKANVIMRRMFDLFEQGNRSIRPTVFTYNAVMMACAETLSIPDADPLEAFKIAVQVFNELRSGGEDPDHVSFGNMLRCAKLLPDGDQKNSVIKSTFSLCARSGFVNEFVVRDLQSTAPEEMWRELLGTPTANEVNMDDLPSHWKSKFEKRKRQPSSSFPRQRNFRR
eukprot:CAMPEP_0172443794 /NCGR_PEP_ID=MMETSP1065-20121228/3992_1 /TAXON_ID=265537 /ORGANISM="Amphiprora paludosa, Strain CCMP125" /LENGTH=854 /DNA_ID=CAMNT_0013194133 /DNA_START=212 /DNA_END=2776 /DNA_ORIENTATION=+